MMAQLLQVSERNWLSPRSREECSAELPSVPSHVSRVSAAGPGTGSSCEEATGETGLGLGESTE